MFSARAVEVVVDAGGDQGGLARFSIATRRARAGRSAGAPDGHDAVGQGQGGVDQMMLEGLRLMLVGMFTVFAFLGLLVGLMKAQAAFFAANAHRFPEEAPRDSVGGRSGRGQGDAEVAAAIALATAMRRGQKV